MCAHIFLFVFILFVSSFCSFFPQQSWTRYTPCMVNWVMADSKSFNIFIRIENQQSRKIERQEEIDGRRNETFSYLSQKYNSIRWRPKLLKLLLLLLLQLLCIFCRCRFFNLYHIFILCFFPFYTFPFKLCTFFPDFLLELSLGQYNRCRLLSLLLLKFAVDILCQALLHNIFFF